MHRCGISLRHSCGIPVVFKGPSGNYFNFLWVVRAYPFLTDHLLQAEAFNAPWCVEDSSAKRPGMAVKGEACFAAQHGLLVEESVSEKGGWTSSATGHKVDPASS